MAGKRTQNCKNARIITDNLPQIISDILVILIEIVEGLTDGLIDWLDSDEGLEKLLSLLLQIQKSLEKLVSKALTKLVDMLDKHKGDFAKFLADSMASANRTLPVILKAVLKLITAIVESVAGAFEDESFINSIVESIEKTIDAVIAILPRFIGAIIKLIINIISAIVPKLPEIIMYVVSAIAKALPSMAGDIAKALSGGIAKIFSSIFTKDFWIDTLKSFGTVLKDIVKSAFSGFSSSSGGFDIMGILDPIGIRHWFADGTQNASAGLSVVGEAGPELVRFRGGEQVINNKNTQKLLSGANGNTNNFNVTFNNLQDTSAFAMMNQFKQYNRQMAINGII